MSQFYALLVNGQIRQIDLAEEIVESTRSLFVNAAAELMDDDTESIAFDGRYIIRDGENEISYITMDLPPEFNDIPANQTSRVYFGITMGLSYSRCFPAGTCLRTSIS